MPSEISESMELQIHGKYLKHLGYSGFQIIYKKRLYETNIYKFHSKVTENEYEKHLKPIELVNFFNGQVH